MKGRFKIRVVAGTLALVLALFAGGVLAPEAFGRKVRYRMKAGTEKNTSASEAMEKMKSASEAPAGTFAVDAKGGSNDGYRLEQITFSGFDKPAGSSKESFFITNGTDRTLAGVALNIEYITPDGRQLHKRFVRIDCNVPQGETRKVDIRSWDTQRSFQYIRSRKQRPDVAAFDVRFEPARYFLRY